LEELDMNARRLFGLATWLVAFGALGCGGTTKADDDDVVGDGDADADSDGDADPGCTDLDRDGAGIGDGCQSDDCDDADPFLVNNCGDDALCEAGVHVTGCPCGEPQPMPCYTGPADTAALGSCRPGLRDCVDGVFQECGGQVVPVPETCDAEDQDCDGVTDNGVLSECGNCNNDCEAESVGVDADHAFDPDSPGARGVVLLPDGSITLGNTVVIANRVIWIANSGQGTVSKIDTTTNEELGRYYTDPGQMGDPSRSTVNPHGDVISANRGTGSATFILASDCPDQDQDGRVETSTGPDDILTWGEDECVIWNIDLGAWDARGSAIEERVELDGLMHEYAWIGSYGSGDMWEIDVEAGELTGRQFNSSPASPYGAAMGPDHTLWVTTSGASMAKVDTETLEVTQYAAPAGVYFYGITVDRDGYVWLSGYQGGAQRFDPATETYEPVVGGCGGGIAADVNGFIWTGHGYICNPRGVARIDPATMTAEVVETGGDTHGVAIDFDGFVWGINVNGGNAHKIDPDTLEFEVAWTSGVNYNYTYSDMTGYQLINATQELAKYAYVFTGCEGADDQETEWAQLTWFAETPAGTSVSFTGRTADSVDQLAAAQIFPIAAQPPDVSPVSIGDAITAAGLEHGRYLEVEASLTSAQRDAAPILDVFQVAHSCSGIFQ
jgi:streptogramin lyase